MEPWHEKYVQNFLKSSRRMIGDGRRSAGEQAVMSVNPKYMDWLKRFIANLFRCTESCIMWSMTYPGCTESPEGTCAVSLCGLTETGCNTCELLYIKNCFRNIMSLFLTFYLMILRTGSQTKELTAQRGCFSFEPFFSVSLCLLQSNSSQSHSLNLMSLTPRSLFPFLFYILLLSASLPLCQSS